MTIYCIINSNNQITTLFGGPQSPPTPAGYTEMADNDPRWAAYQLAQAQTSQITALTTSYQNAIAYPVSYTSVGGVAKTYQADSGSAANLQAAIAGCSAAQATPTGFYWVASDNTQVPFAFADLQGLASAMFAQGAVAFQHLQTLKAEVTAATTSAGIAAIVW